MLYPEKINFRTCPHCHEKIGIKRFYSNLFISVENGWYCDHCNNKVRFKTTSHIIFIIGIILTTFSIYIYITNHGKHLIIALLIYLASIIFFIWNKRLEKWEIPVKTRNKVSGKHQIFTQNEWKSIVKNGNPENFELLDNKEDKR